MNTRLMTVALSNHAIYLPGITPRQGELQAPTLGLVAQMARLGYTLDEQLLHAVDALLPTQMAQLLEELNYVNRRDLNWTPLTRDWLQPTGVTVWDYFVTTMANVLKDSMEVPGVTLPCGHLIPTGTFDLSRYNGCPYCGTPFHTSHTVIHNEGAEGHGRICLTWWGEEELMQYYHHLLESPVPLNMSQCMNLALLLTELPLPQGAVIRMKETRISVMDELVSMGEGEKAGELVVSPTDVLRYVWYKKTRSMRIQRPVELVEKAGNEAFIYDRKKAMENERRNLRLHFTRPQSRMMARWLCGIKGMTVEQQCEAMHPHRQMWVRLIRALRLAEWARKSEFEALAPLLDKFYRQDYSVWQGQVIQARSQGQRDEMLRLLKQRPGQFARSLFSTMLWMGPEPVLAAFREVVPQLPTRLLLTLGVQAALYFDPTAQRLARPVTGNMVPIEPHQLLTLYDDKQLLSMQQAVSQLYMEAMRQHYIRQVEAPGFERPQEPVYIDPRLDDVPVAVSNRTQTVQTTGSALQGTRFTVEGDRVRLFLQWGVGLPAQHLDMDLSCYIMLENDENIKCSYYNLTVPGAQHSGDIQHIPDQVGAAEYIELDLPQLEQRGATMVAFTCNAYTNGKLQPNLVVGWMNACYDMKVDDETGVAYDPATVQHMVSVAEGNLAKGLVFGVLHVKEREITWLEVPFSGRTVEDVSADVIKAYLKQLRAQPSVGKLLHIMAEAQGWQLADDTSEAQTRYTYEWALDTAAVSALLMG